MTLHIFTGWDGNGPVASLVLSGQTLYGTTLYGGANGNGTIFAVNTDGTSFTNLHAFSLSGFSDGTDPDGGLILFGNTLYGTASVCGTNGYGTLFALNTDGSNFNTLHAFARWYDGGLPSGGLVLSGGNLYGTAQEGGANDTGTLFSISLESPAAPQPTLTIIHSETNVVLMWPTNATGFFLQFATNLVTPKVWSANLFSPVVVNTNYVLTNSISGMRMFYRLSQ